MVVEKLVQADNKSYTVDSTIRRNGMPVYSLRQTNIHIACIEKYISNINDWIAKGYTVIMYVCTL